MASGDSKKLDRIIKELADLRRALQRVGGYAVNKKGGKSSKKETYTRETTIDPAYDAPPLALLDTKLGIPDAGDVHANMRIIQRTLQNFGIKVETGEIVIGPHYARYTLKPSLNTKIEKIVALRSNLELALSVAPIRIEAPIRGTSLVGIEVPNIISCTIGLKSLISEKIFTDSSMMIPIPIGRRITGEAVCADLAKLPHLLIGGAVGTGKSIFLHGIIVSLLYRFSPEQLRLVLVDTKRVEMMMYKEVPHLLTPTITDSKKAIIAFKWLVKEMDRRYMILENERVRDITAYHSKIHTRAIEEAKNSAQRPSPDAMPYVVVVIDELADLMATHRREAEALIVRLAMLSRAVGIHMIVSTMRPSANVLTGLIKVNLPCRAAFAVAAKVDSRLILDQGGAEQLLGAGDMLFQSATTPFPERIQTAYISDDEIQAVVDRFAQQEDTGQHGATPSSVGQSQPVFTSNKDYAEQDELFTEAKKAVQEVGKASTSYLQRKLGVGYARAAQLMDLLEEAGIIGPADGSKPRHVLEDSMIEVLKRIEDSLSSQNDKKEKKPRKKKQKRNRKR